MAALKRVLEPAFSGAAAAAQMLTVKDFLLLSCLALGGSIVAAVMLDARCVASAAIVYIAWCVFSDAIA